MSFWNWISGKSSEEQRPSASARRPFRAAIVGGSADAVNVAEFQFVENTLFLGDPILLSLQQDKRLSEQEAILKKLLSLLRQSKEKLGTQVSGFTIQNMETLKGLGTSEKPLRTEEFPLTEEKSAANLLRHFMSQRGPGIAHFIVDKPFCLADIDIRKLHGGCSVQGPSIRLGGG